MLANVIAGYDQRPDPYFVDRSDGMNITDRALKSVAFLGTKEGRRFLPRATCFFVQYTQGQHGFDHLVTAQHVVSGLVTKHEGIWLRVNLVNGKVAELQLDATEFRYHPDPQIETDIAVYPISPFVCDDSGGTVAMDTASLVLNGPNGFLPSADFRKRHMGRGAEIYAIGLFRSHAGANRNIPIVRVGNIAMLPDPKEPIKTDAGYVEAYLVEARSIAGLSGSPVFANPELALELARALGKEPMALGAALLGMVHGHFDIENLNEDVVSGGESSPSGIHTGIGVVIPVEKIMETIEQEELTAMRQKIVDAQWKGGAKADLASDDDALAPHSTDANPTHREDFMRLVGAAARKPPQED